jgi:hypothetical protein
MLKSHMEAKEATLLAISKVPANTGHPLHKGTPREAFIREFLAAHLPANLAISSGEIFDASSKPGQKRNQFDIVIHRKGYPKLEFGGGVHGFMIESVLATVEVKSVLTEADIDQAVGAAANAKALIPNVSTSFHTGYIPPKILNYVVAYDGPAKMETVCGWIDKAHKARGIILPTLPSVDGAARLAVAAPSIDGVFVLGKGFLYFDNVPSGFANNARATKNFTWVTSDCGMGSLLLFFTFLTTASQNVEAKFIELKAYLSSFTVKADIA